MERTSNFKFSKKNKSYNYKSSNYISNQNATKNIETNFNQNKTSSINFSRNQPNVQIINKNKTSVVNFSGSKNNDQYSSYNSSQIQPLDKIEHQVSDIVSLHAQINNNNNISSIKDNSSIKDEIVIKQNNMPKLDFYISYKDKAYTYIIPEIILKKEKELLPFWLQPIHVKLIPNDSSTFDFCNDVFIRLSQTGARIEIDNKQDSVLKKIKNAELDKVPYIIVIGPKEKSIHKFIVRALDGSQKLFSVGAFYHVLEEQLDNKPKSKINYI